MNDLTDSTAFSNFFFSANMVGSGDYGFVFELDNSRVVKVVDVLSGNPLLSPEAKEAKLLAEVAMQQAAAQVRTPNGLPCVPPVLSAVHRVRVRDDAPVRFLFYVMTKLEPLSDMSISDVKHIIFMSDCLIRSGLIHNDMHAGNVMQLAKTPILIDTGLMTQNDPIISEPVHTFVQYAQCSALIDCCTVYNEDAQTSPLAPVWTLQNEVQGLFTQKGIAGWNREVESQEDYVARVATQMVNTFNESTPTIQLQLILAHLSLQFAWDPNKVTLGFQTDICAIGAPIGDAIYAIRNPDDFGYTITNPDALLRDLVTGRVNLPYDT